MSESQDKVPLIDLSDFERVVARLREALTAYREDAGNSLALDSSIKRFELTYEVATKLLRRFLMEGAASAPEMANLSFQGLIREADDRELVLHGWPEWKRFRDARNETVHTYREAKAREVMVDAEAFLPEAEFLLESLQKRMGKDD